MKKFLLIISTLVFSSQAFLLPGYSQANNEVLKAEDKAAVIELADRFIQRLDETSEIEPLIKEMFVEDFAARYVKEKKAEAIEENSKPDDDILLTSGLEYKTRLLDEASEEDWRQIQISVFNIMNYMSGNLMNRMAKSILSKKEPDDDELFRLMMNLFTKKVTNIFDNDRVLRNFIVMKERTPINSLEELRRVNSALAKALEILKKEKTWSSSKMTSEAKQVQKMYREKSGEESAPTLLIADRETFGYPKGTRLVTIFANLMTELTVVKVGNDYKIVQAKLSFPAG